MLELVGGVPLPSGTLPLSCRRVPLASLVLPLPSRPMKSAEILVISWCTTSAAPPRDPRSMKAAEILLLSWCTSSAAAPRDPRSMRSAQILVISRRTTSPPPPRDPRSMKAVEILLLSCCTTFAAPGSATARRPCRDAARQLDHLGDREFAGRAIEQTASVRDPHHSLFDSKCIHLRAVRNTVTCRYNFCRTL